MTDRKPRPYMRMELNSPGIRLPIEWRRVMDTVEALEAAEERASDAGHEARRLRGLIKETFNDRSRADCQWCDGDPGAPHQHAADCPAFTPSGDVK